MNTLWTFGDSFTEGYGCSINDAYHINYYQNDDKIWPVWLSESLNADLKNYGMGGYSNDMILDSIIDNWRYIKKDDYVFIGSTYSHRFDIPMGNVLKSVVHSFPEKKDNGLTNEEFETAVNFQYHFSDNILYKNRQVKRFEWIKSLLQKKCKLVVIWDVQYDIQNLETITGATNRKIVDGHLSYKGHKLLGEIFYKKYMVKNFI
jgi:hypothetical protein